MKKTRELSARSVPKSGYSSTVRLTLVVCDIELALSHVGSKFVIVKQVPKDIDSCDAEIVVLVDGKINRTSVYLPHGIGAGSNQNVLYLTEQTK